LPPFPITEDKISSGKFDTSPLLEALDQVYVIGVVLATWVTYSIGVFCRDNLIKSKTGTGYIHKEHRKGGRSEKRFTAGLRNRTKIF
jgi:peptide subunit release factor 1 (eRF1)